MGDSWEAPAPPLDAAALPLSPNRAPGLPPTFRCLAFDFCAVFFTWRVQEIELVEDSVVHCGEVKRVKLRVYCPRVLVPLPLASIHSEGCTV